jgi:hypothetical protein
MFIGELIMLIDGNLTDKLVISGLIAFFAGVWIAFLVSKSVLSRWPHASIGTVQRKTTPLLFWFALLLEVIVVLALESWALLAGIVIVSQICKNHF